MTTPTDPCPCESGRAFANCHGAEEARDRAWARLVKAIETRWREDIQGAAQVDYQCEIDAAKQALRGLGVDVDALLEAP